MAAYFPEPSPHQLARGCWLTSAGNSHKAQGQGIERAHGLDRPACIFVTGGRLRHRTDHGSWRIGSSGIIWLLPDQPHAYHGDPSSDEFWFILDGEHCRALFQQRLRASRPICERSDEAQRAAMRRAWEAVSSHHPHANEIACLAIEELLARHEIDADAPTGDDGLVIQALQRIEQSAGRVSPAHLAEELGTGYAGLRRRFRSLRGESMAACCTRMRLQRAKSLLAETDLPVAAIAETCGYDDAFFFARQFRKHNGCSPTAFRGSCRLD
jgi:AraC-like DNA-binding protein